MIVITDAIHVRIEGPHSKITAFMEQMQKRRTFSHGMTVKWLPGNVMLEREEGWFLDGYFPAEHRESLIDAAIMVGLAGA